MDRYWNTTITRSLVLWSVKSYHPIATTWPVSPSKKRRSKPLQRHHWRVQEEEVRRCFAMVTWRLDINSSNRRRSEENISILLESKLFQSIPVPSSNSRTFRRQCCWSCIARQCIVTERIYRVHLPRWEREWIEFCCKKLNYFQEEQASREENKRSSPLQWTWLKTYRAWEKLHAILQKPRIESYKEYLDTPSTYGIWSSLKRKDCNFTRHCHMQSFSTTHCLQLALRMRYVSKLRMSSTRRCA